METGTFRLHGNSFVSGQRKLVIKERKKPSAKPKHYLIQVSPFQYISSLFPVLDTEQEAYTFDYENKIYSLRKAGETIELEALS